MMRDELLRNTAPHPPPSTPGCLSRRGLQTREGLRATLRSRQLAPDAPSTPMQRSRQRSISTPALEEQSSHKRQPSHLRQSPHTDTAVGTCGAHNLSPYSAIGSAHDTACPLTRSPWRSHSSPRWPTCHRPSTMSGALIGLGDVVEDVSLGWSGHVSSTMSGALIGLGDTSPSSAMGLRLRRELIATPASSPSRPGKSSLLDYF